MSVFYATSVVLMLVCSFGNAKNAGKCLGRGDYQGGVFALLILVYTSAVGGYMLVKLIEVAS
jgi:hypothetical protein